MRRIILASTLLIAGCATGRSRPKRRRCSPDHDASRAGSSGSPTSELVGHFGNPALQVREGTSLKLQFRGRSLRPRRLSLSARTMCCRVSHVDTRTLSGVDFDQAACIASLE